MTQRDSEQTRQRILKAVGELLARSGFGEIGVNAIAREAGVDKVLIYRYFGGLPELLEAFAESGEFWPPVQELIAAAESGQTGATVASRAKGLLLAFGRALRKRPLTQEVMRWELMERNGMTDALARQREKQGEELMRLLERETEADVRAIGSILSAGQMYLILRSKTADVFNGLRLNSDEDWERIERAIGYLAEVAFGHGGKPPAGRRKK
jgi:AcrR family transcriptional regulator